MRVLFASCKWGGIVAGNWYSTAELSEEIGVEPETLKGWRWRGVGPAFHKFGHKVRYARRDVDAWIAANRQPTGDEAA
jgi:hypothetical protein